MALTYLGGGPPYIGLLGSDTSKEAQVFDTIFDDMEDALIRMHPWNFLKREVTIVPVPITLVDIDGAFVRLTVAADQNNFRPGDIILLANLPSGWSLNGQHTVVTVASTTVTLGTVFTVGGATTTGDITFPSNHEYTHGIPLPADFRALRWVEEYGHELDYDARERAIFTNETSLDIAYTGHKFNSPAITLNYDYFPKDYIVGLALYLAWGGAYAITQSHKTRDAMWEMFTRHIRKARHTDSIENPRKALQNRELIEARQGRRFLANPDRYV